MQYGVGGSFGLKSWNVRPFVSERIVMNERIAGAEMQMVSIRQHNLTADLAKVFGSQTAFDRARSRDVHENGGFNSTVYRFQTSAPCVTLLS